MEHTITQAELDERVAILRRFRTLLEQQRNKFREYLAVLEMQETEISLENADAILAHSELEEQIVRNIGSLQKVIVPMQKLYDSSRNTYDPAESMPVSRIQDELALLQNQVLAQNERNRTLLRSHIASLRSQMALLQNPYRKHQSIYADTGTTGSMVQLQA